MRKMAILALSSIAISGCLSVAQHKSQVNDSADRITVGNVQREIIVGMSGADVARVLGSPNIVTTDESRREVWIYDKIATEVAYSTSSGGLSALILGFGGQAAAAVAPSYNRNTGASSRSQRTLTVIIKFDENKVVRDFAYHTSRF